MMGDVQVVHILPTREPDRFTHTYFRYREGLYITLLNENKCNLYVHKAVNEHQ